VMNYLQGFAFKPLKGAGAPAAGAN
jgi:hypothetical protein